MKPIFYFILVIILIQCQTPDKFHTIQQTFDTYTKVTDANENINDYWYFKDIVDDTIPGISLEKAKNTIIKQKEGTEVIVAVIDGRFDINHPALKKHLWKNPDEKLNFLDDDGNGFVDDLYGWNFMGNNHGENATSVNQEYVRIIKLYKERFKNKTIDSIKSDEIEAFELYKNAKEVLKAELEYEKKYFNRSNKYYQQYIPAREALKSWFPDYKYNLSTLNKIDTINNPSLIPYVKEIAEVIEWKETDELKTSNLKERNERLNKILNVDFDDRALVGDNPYDINDTIYGNNQINAYAEVYDHGTRIFGTITSIFNDDKSSDNLKVIVLSKSPSGDFYDKDVALAIRYAVNKGARVINMSFGKAFSLNNQWIHDAMKYAEDNNVLLVCSSGNSAKNMDNEIQYPTDHDSNGNETLSNVLTVGASGYTADEKLKTAFSNYGISNVDVFAPGIAITTPFPNHNNYGFPQYYDSDAGTSLSAALTSGVAALLFSYYPDLTAQDIKNILMESGIEYTFPVNISDKKESDSLVPFNTLSKSGKIINVYNALLMAENYKE